MKVYLYVEGGGRESRKASRLRAEEAFGTFLRKAGFTKRMPRIVAGGSRRSTHGRFCTAIEAKDPDALPVLLVDSEGPVSPKHSPWEHLNSRRNDPMSKPRGATDNQCYLMVQMMESWFLADHEAVKSYFGQGVVERHLQPVANVEIVLKSDVVKRLESASKHSQKGRYDKSGHAFELLQRINPEKVERASAHAKRLFDFLRVNLV